MKILRRTLQLWIMAFLVLLVTSFASGHKKGDQVTCLRAPAPPIIDGELNEWNTQTSITGYLTPDSGNVCQFRNEPLPENAEDCSFDIFAMWDEDNFYIAGEIVDDVVLLDNPNKHISQCPELCDIYIDSMNKGGFGRSLGWSIGNRNGKEPIAFQSDPVERDALDFDLVLDAPETPLRRGKPGWIFELRLGETSFDPDPIKLEPNHIIGVLLLVTDTDKDGNRKLIFCPAGADTNTIPNKDAFKLVFSAQPAPGAAVSFQDNLAITWGQIKVAD